MAIDRMNKMLRLLVVMATSCASRPPPADQSEPIAPTSPTVVSVPAPEPVEGTPMVAEGHPDPFALAVDIRQDGLVQHPEPGRSIHLARAPFSITFVLADDVDRPNGAVRLAAAPKLPTYAVGQSFEETSFGPGHAMAAYEDGYRGVLYLRDSGFHYLFTGDEESRIRLVEEIAPGWVRGAFDVEVASVRETLDGPEKPWPLTDPTLKRLDIAILRDGDADNVIDEGELVELRIVFR